MCTWLGARGSSSKTTQGSTPHTSPGLEGIILGKLCPQSAMALQGTRLGLGRTSLPRMTSFPGDALPAGAARTMLPGVLLVLLVPWWSIRGLKYRAVSGCRHCGPPPQRTGSPNRSTKNVNRSCTSSPMTKSTATVSPGEKAVTNIRGAAWHPRRCILSSALSIVCFTQKAPVTVKKGTRSGVALVLVNVAVMVNVPAGPPGTGVGSKAVSKAGSSVTKSFTTGKNSKAPMSQAAVPSPSPSTGGAGPADR